MLEFWIINNKEENINNLNNVNDIFDLLVNLNLNYEKSYKKYYLIKIFLYY